MFKKAFAILLLLFLGLLLRPGQALSSDVRMAGMGGGIAIWDFENDVFLNPSVLADLTNHVVIAGIGYRYINESYLLQSPMVLELEVVEQAYNPAIGFMIPIKITGTSFAALWGGDYSKFSNGNGAEKANYSIINLRVAQKIGKIGMGLGYDAIMNNVSEFPKKQILIGLNIDKNGNNISTTLGWQRYAAGWSACNIDLKWQYHTHKWLHTSAKGGYQYETDCSSNRFYKYYTDLGFNVLIAPIQANIYWATHLEYYNDYQNDYAFYFNAASVGLEKQITPIWTVRAGYMPGSRPMKPYATVYDGTEGAIGTSVKVNNNIKIEYACNFYVDTVHHNHFFKIIYLW